MADSKKQARLEVKVKTLSLLMGPLRSTRYKIDSLLEDHYNKRFVFQNQNLVSLLELKISTEVVVSFLEDLLTEAREEKVNRVFLEPFEIKSMMTVVQSIQAASFLSIQNTNLLDN